jgi:RimJ/RimL family protein N-acetyltransferase
MTPGEIVFQGTSKNNKQFIIRYLMESDVEKTHQFINTISKEKTYITFQGEEITLEGEKKFVASILQRMEEKKGLALMVFVDEKLVGFCTLEMKERTFAHEGVLAISIAKDFRHEGIGKKLMETMLQETKNLTDLKIVSLGVFGDNQTAYNLYKELGFKESGRIPKGVFYKGQFVDHLFMYKFVNEFK